MLVTRHAPVALINQDNIHVLEKLHPPSLRCGCIKTGTSTCSGGTRQKFKATPTQVIKTISQLDLYINAAQRLNLNHSKELSKAKTLAGFFNKVINGKVTPQFQTFIRQTYLVALEKDPDDKTKLQPLVVPSAIRWIAGILVLLEYEPTFVEYLLPFNYAIGVGGGVNVVIKTIQLAVDQCIIEPEENGDLPSLSLVSLDIKIMFNVVSRERLREIIAEKFPTLEAYADLICDGPDETFVRLEDGEWRTIAVTEGIW